MEIEHSTGLRPNTSGLPLFLWANTRAAENLPSKNSRPPRGGLRAASGCRRAAPASSRNSRAIPWITTMPNIENITVRIVASGIVLRFRGRDACALHCLIIASETGCTPVCDPGPRWSGYVFKLRRAGLDDSKSPLQFARQALANICRRSEPPRRPFPASTTEPEADFAAVFIAWRYRVAAPLARAIVALPGLGRAFA